MRDILRRSFLIVSLFISFFGVFGQCQWDRFKDATNEATTSGKELSDAIDDDISLIDVWEEMDNAGFTNLNKRHVISRKELNNIGAHNSLKNDLSFLVDFYESSNKLKTAYSVSGSMSGKAIGHTFTKHGTHNTKQLLYQAKNGSVPQGQWLDDVAAEEFISRHLDQLAQGTIDIPIPNSLKGIGRSFKSGTGEIFEPTHIRLVPSGSGVKTAFPVSESLEQIKNLGTFKP